MKAGLAAAVLLFGATLFAQAPNQPATPAHNLQQTEPETQLEDRPMRVPEDMVPTPHALEGPPSNMQTDVDIDRYIGDASQAPSRQWDNVLYTQNILSAGNSDPSVPGDPGAVLRYARSLDLATLPGWNIGPLVRDPGQYILYVESGQGRLDDGTQYWPLRQGIAVLMPPNALHRFTNTGGDPLKMLIVTYGMDGVTPRKDILVRDTNLMANTENDVHWSNMSKYIFEGPDGLFPTDKVLLVCMGPMTMAAPHSHSPGQQELWIKVSGGPAIMEVGSEIRHWKKNMALLVPPSGRTNHAAINLSNKIESWLYYSRLNPNPQPGEHRRQFGPPNPFIGEALTRSTQAGKPLSSLPPDAYHW